MTNNMITRCHKNPLVTIILTSYNHEAFIKDAIQSVLDQSFEDFELLIYDDHSDDSSWDIINSFEDNRIKKFRSKKNIVPIEMINRGIYQSSGKYIAIHHSDDLWEPLKIEKQVDYLKNNSNVGAVFTRVKVVNSDLSLLENKEHPYYEIFDKHENRSRYEWLNYFFHHGNCLCHPSVLMRADIIKKIGLYRFTPGGLGDFDCWVRICFESDIYILSDKLTIFRVHTSQKVQNSSTDSSIFAHIRGHNSLYFILKSYLKINSFDILKKIFFNSKILKETKSNNYLYVLGMIFIHEKKHPIYTAIGLEILFELLNDSNWQNNIDKNFAFKDFRELAKEYEMHNSYRLHLSESRALKYQSEIQTYQSEIQTYQSEIKTYQSEIKTYQSEIYALYSSRSWKITKPLRYLSNKIDFRLKYFRIFFQKMYNIFRRIPH